MKLVIAIVHDQDKQRMTDELLLNGFPFTQIGSTGGFFGESCTHSATLLLGVEDAQAEKALRIIRDRCCTREQVINPLPPEVVPAGPLPTPTVKEKVGGAVCFVLDVESCERL